jgi:hypothetical protein
VIRHGSAATATVRMRPAFLDEYGRRPPLVADADDVARERDSDAWWANGVLALISVEQAAFAAPWYAARFTNHVARGLAGALTCTGKSGLIGLNNSMAIVAASQHHLALSDRYLTTWGSGFGEPNLGNAATLGDSTVSFGAVAVYTALVQDGAGTGATLVSYQTPQPTTALSTFELLLSRWRSHLAPRMFTAIEWHIRRLLSDEDELAEDNFEPSQSSFTGLLTFLAKRPWLKSPSIGLDRHGIFAASWRPSRDAKANLVLQFLIDQTVRWFVVDAGAPKIISGSGVVKPEQVEGILTTYQITKWLVAR